MVMVMWDSGGRVEKVHGGGGGEDTRKAAEYPFSAN